MKKIGLIWFVFAGFVSGGSLFNGKDLTGWKSDAKGDFPYWTVSDGVLHCVSGPERRGCHLWTEREFEDFDLTLEFRVVEGVVDSGVMLRGAHDQIQIGISGSMKRDMTASPYIPKKGYPVEAVEAAKTFKAEGWNELRIEAKGNVYRTWLNGVEGVTYESETAKKKGPIGLQLHVKNKMKIDFRNIEIEELVAARGKMMRALIVDGQNNHAVWPKSTIMLKTYLEESGLFEAEVARTASIWKWERERAWLPLAGVGERERAKEPKPDANFAPDFSKYDLVVSNFGWKASDFPESTKRSFEKWMQEGGAFVVVHAANNPWAEWEEFNRMIGLGGWGGRNHEDGPYVYINDAGEVVRDESRGGCGAHGPQNEFVVTIRDREHPITKGLPDFWVHGKDECYSKLRGPAENLTILATACDTPELQAAGRHEPMLMTIEYHEGRVFHTTLGHDTPAFECVGFQTTFLRGAEWAVTGQVTQEIPEDFPCAEEVRLRKFPNLPELQNN
ncbi:MAG: family 16 glycoside hydrolase [Verrucomicrobiota bacterium]